MKIVLLSNHYYRSLRRAGFHLLADAFHDAGHEVTFVTTGLSRISYLRRDYRTAYPDLRAAHGQLIEERPGFFSYVHYTPWHPHTLLLPWLNVVTAPLMNRYRNYSLGAAEARIMTADVVIYESCNALFLFHKCRELAPAVAHVYRVSDDVRILRSAHPCLFDLEMEIAGNMDLISVPCQYLADKFQGLNPNVRVQPHGVDTALFNRETSSPYSAGTRNGIFVGNAYLDHQFIIKAAAECPDVCFHVIGKFPTLVSADNIRCYGELPFEQTVPYIKFADIGLCSLDLSLSCHMASFTDPLKVKQYRYCGLPVIAPRGLDLRREGIFYYDLSQPGSCCRAVRDALSTGRHSEWANEVQGWNTVAADLIAALPTQHGPE